MFTCWGNPIESFSDWNVIVRLLYPLSMWILKADLMVFLQVIEMAEYISDVTVVTVRLSVATVLMLCGMPVSMFAFGMLSREE